MFGEGSFSTDKSRTKKKQKEHVMSTCRQKTKKKKEKRFRGRSFLLPERFGGCFLKWRTPGNMYSQKFLLGLCPPSWMGPPKMLAII